MTKLCAKGQQREGSRANNDHGSRSLITMWLLTLVYSRLDTLTARNLGPAEPGGLCILVCSERISSTKSPAVVCAERRWKGFAACA